MNTVPAVQTDDTGTVLEQVVINADLSKLKSADRVTYYHAVCKSLGLNHLTQPFSYIWLNGKLTLYAKRDATDQLRKVHGVAVEDMTEVLRGDLIIVTCRVKDSKGRTDVAKGVVSIAGLKGEGLANAIMKAETKAKRRATLSIVGLGWADETEVATIPDAVPVQVDPETGELTEDGKGEMPESLENEIWEEPPEALKEAPAESAPAKPHLVPPRGEFPLWADDLLGHINRATSVREINDWLILNTQPLRTLEKNDRGTYNGLKLAVELRRRAMGGANEK